MLRLCGAELREVPAVPYRDENNYVKVSGRIADELSKTEPTEQFGPINLIMLPTVRGPTKQPVRKFLSKLTEK
ncbi:MAG: hypothetical protein Ct9H300mP28_25670 [Pseudomonadota bacterium]|nr:MAG: hypothetical protein Ct9H300mP28_25670 [Pseudomonadota bacterium]